MVWTPCLADVDLKSPDYNVSGSVTNDFIKNYYIWRMQSTIRSIFAKWWTNLNNHSSHSFTKSIFFPLIKLIHPDRSQVNYFWTSISIFLLLNTLFTVISIRYSWTITNQTSIMICAIIAFITNSYQYCRSDIRVTYHTLSLAFFA